MGDLSDNDAVDEDNVEKEEVIAQPKTSLEIFLEDIQDPGIYELSLVAEKPTIDYDVAGVTAYIEACRRLNVIPVSYFIRHITDSQINLAHHGIGPLGTQAICEALVTNPHVVSLNLEDNFIEADGAMHLANLLKESVIISELNLAYNNLQSEGAAHVEYMLIYNNPQLRKLNIAGNKFKDPDAENICIGLDGNDRLQVLNISHNEFGHLAGKVIGYQIASNLTIEKLDISWNNLRGPAANYFCQAIRANQTLTYLDLSWNGIGDEATIILSRTLPPTVMYLDISSNRIEDAGASAMGKNLEKNETLTTLKMGLNPLTPEGTNGLLKSILKMPTSPLKTLDLQHVYVNDEFVSLYSQIEALREFYVEYAGVYHTPSVKLKTRSNIDYETRLYRVLEIAKELKFRIQNVLLELDVDSIPAHEFRTYLEKYPRAKIPKNYADEIAMWLSDDGNIYCRTLAEELDKVPEPLSVFEITIK